MYIKRNIEKVLNKAISQFPVVLITGPRQCGKSTLLKHTLKGYSYITFDDMSIRELAEKDPALFLKTYKAPLIIDEIQYVPSLLSYIKMHVDENRSSYGQYVLTGSQIFALMHNVTESLAGRVAILELYPFSWKELPKQDLFDEIVVAKQILNGFYPEPFVQKDLDVELWQSSYLTTYIERDLRNMKNIHDLNLFQKFLILLAARAGQILNLNEVGKDCGISQTTAKDWLSLLQTSSLIYLLQPYFKNITKRVVKRPKLFFTDTGLLCYLLKINSVEQLVHSPFAGHIFENMCVTEKLKENSHKGKRSYLYFYRTSNGDEIDLIEDFGESINAYEIKFSSTPKQSMSETLAKLKKELPIKEASLLTLRKEILPFSNTISSFHWSKILEE